MSRTSTKTATKSNVVSIAPPQPVKPHAISLELVIRRAPDHQLVENLVRTFGLEPVDFDCIRDALGAQIRAAGEILGDALNERALQIHLQRIVGAHVASAYGAAQFYGAKLSAAQDLTTRLGNDDRDEDRGGPSGFGDKAARYIRRELDVFFSTLPSVAEGFHLKTWRGGPDAGKPKLPPTAKGLIARGLMRLDNEGHFPRLFFTEVGLTALRAMMTDRRLVQANRTTVCFAY